VLQKHLIKLLSESLDCNLARIKCLCLLLIGLLRHRTVNLTILATGNSSEASNQSCYRRFQDFFLNFALPLSAIGRLMLSKIPKPSEGWVLSMDRTNWKYGKRHINILVIGIVVNKVAIPIVWKVLPQRTKRGNSNTRQRISLLKKLLQLVDARDILVLTMDREFCGKKWLRWLDTQGVGYVLRVKSNTVIGDKPAREHASTRGRKTKGCQNIWGMDLFFSSKPIKRGGRASHLCVISNRFSGREALDWYQKRWGIELLFSHLKKRGFDLEATHMTDGAKLEKLFALVSLAFLFSFGWGCQLRASRVATKAMARKSLFREGLEDILRILANNPAHSDGFRNFIRWLKCPDLDSFFIV
jgi:hypothetical protein